MRLVKEILHQHNLKGTPARMDILSSIIKSHMPLSESDIKSIDRVTFYRSIKCLLDANIIQGLISKGKEIKYAYSQEDRHNQSASLFYCVQCQTTANIQIEIQLPVMPDQPKEKICHITITGICKACTNKSAQD